MGERIQKLIAASGLCSRRAAEALIEEGRVAVNGRAARLGESASAEDFITVDGKALPDRGGLTYIMLNKPRGYVTTMSDEKGRKTVAELVSDAGVRVFPVGRLDMDSEGLLLMTNDGELANRIMHPSHRVVKTYQVRVAGEDIQGSAELLSQPMDIDGCTVGPAGVKILREDREGRALLSVSITEGRNRQIRKMCEKVGFTVLRLKRTAEGGLTLGELPAGKWRFLSKNEINKLQKQNNLTKNQ